MKPVRIIVIAAAVIVLAALFFVLKPDASNSKNTNTTSTTSSATAQPRVIELTITDGKLTSGEGLIKAKQGELLTFKVTSDTASELHLHGYNKSVELEPGKTASLTLTADKSGSFEAELHETESQVFVLEVQPE